MRRYIVLEKAVGETPLQVLERFKTTNQEYKNVSMAYAGRLDPMASGKLLVLVGDECKKQKDYHGLDKEYEFSVLLGTSSDTGDVLGLLKTKSVQHFNESELQAVAGRLVGDLALPYPHFSSKTIKGKPLHVWTLEKRLDEIEIPVAHTHVYKLKLVKLEARSAKVIYDDALARINSLPPVTEESKALGRDFRREDVRKAWQQWLEANEDKDLQIATFRCVASSGTYMRSLAEEIGRRLSATALAYSIHRTIMGHYVPMPFRLGFWRQKYK